MKDTLKYFWMVFVIQFIIIELSLFVCHYLTNPWLQFIGIGGIILEFFFIHKNKGWDNKNAEIRQLAMQLVRQRFLSICERMAFNTEIVVTEETNFFNVCHDWWDFIELIMECEKEFNCHIDETEKTENSFDTVKQFIDWASLNVTQWLAG
jgi:acyl carrier protein